MSFDMSDTPGPAHRTAAAALAAKLGPELERAQDVRVGFELFEARLDAMLRPLEETPGRDDALGGYFEL